MVRLNSNKMTGKFPGWLKFLLQSKFFEPCSNHGELRNCEMKVFCVDCRVCLCLHCFATPLHSGHRQLQIRRYMYKEVVRIQDMHGLMDCSRIMPYTINGAKVILLHTRLQAKPPPMKCNGGGPNCRTCERMIAEPNRYCSIACKLLMEDKNSGWDSLEFSEIVDRENTISPTESESSCHSTESSPAISAILKLRPRPDILKLRPIMHKRKGVPSRSPFF